MQSGRVEESESQARFKQGHHRPRFASGRLVTVPLATGDRQQVNTYADGTVQTKLFKTNGEETATAPDGTVTTVLGGFDPRFGMLAPVPLGG